MSDKQPEALRLAEHLEAFRSFPDDIAAAEELRRLYAVNQELLDALAEISLCSQNSMSNKEDGGRIARAAIAKSNRERSMKAPRNERESYAGLSRTQHKLE